MNVNVHTKNSFSHSSSLRFRTTNTNERYSYNCSFESENGKVVRTKRHVGRFRSSITSAGENILVEEEELIFYSLLVEIVRLDSHLE